MQQVVSITSQGQLTIPKKMLKAFGITKGSRAIIKKVGSKLEVKPQPDFWSLKGSLKSKVKLTDKQLREARKEFESSWAQE